jgi:hypothetical protein
VWAFSDESERADKLIAAVVFASPSAVPHVRATMSGLLLPGQQRIHTSDESARRRRALLDAVARIDHIDAVALRLRRSKGADRVACRQRLLEEATGLIADRGVTAWTLDDMPPAARNRDRNTIGHAVADLLANPGRRLVYDHRASRDEPALWVADLIAWTVGAGGDWRRRIGPITEIRDIAP